MATISLTVFCEKHDIPEIAHSYFQKKKLFSAHGALQQPCNSLCFPARDIIHYLLIVFAGNF